MRAYIAGPMRGKVNYNFDAFSDAKGALAEIAVADFCGIECVGLAQLLEEEE